MSAPVLHLPPYAQAMGVTVDRWEEGMPVLACDYSDLVCGNPGTFHGGALGGILEMAAMAALRVSRPALANQPGLGPFTITIDYLRTATAQPLYAAARPVRVGRRLAIVQAEAWQDDRSRAMVTALVKVALTPAG